MGEYVSSRQILDELERIETKFGRRFTAEDLAETWPQLLAANPYAVTRGVHEIVARWKWWPRPEKILQTVQRWEKFLDKWQHRPAEIRLEILDEEKEFFRLYHRHLAQEIEAEEYEAGLYRLADHTGKPGYALTGRESERKRKA